MLEEMVVELLAVSPQPESMLMWNYSAVFFVKEVHLAFEKAYVQFELRKADRIRPLNPTHRLLARPAS